MSLGQSAVTYEGRGDGGEGEEVFRLALVAAVEAPAAGQPGRGPFHDPAVPAQVSGCPCGRDGAGCRGRRAIAAGEGSRSPCRRAACRASDVGGRDGSGFPIPSCRGRSDSVPSAAPFERPDTDGVDRAPRPVQLAPGPSSSRTRRWSLAHTRASVHSVNRRKTVTPNRPKPGGSWFQVQPEVPTKMMAASTSRSPRRRCPPPRGRTGAGGTTRWNNVHRSSGAIHSTSAAVITPDCRKITPTEMAPKTTSTPSARPSADACPPSSTGVRAS